MTGFKTITFTLTMLSIAGCGGGENVVEDFCKYVTDRQKEFSVTPEQIEEFRGSEDRTTRYVAFYETITSAGIPSDVAMSELARFAFHGQTNATNKLDKIITAYDHTHVSDVKSVGAACRNMQKTLSKGNVPNARIVRYLVSFLVATPEDRQKLEKDCAAFVQMYGVVSDFVREMVTEAEDAKIIFTDGSLDEEIHEECKRRRVTLEPCSMMGRTFSRETFMEKMTNGLAVAQLGLETLRRMDKTKLCFSGNLFRYGKMSENVRVKGVEFAKKLAERILDLQKRNVVDSLNDEEMKSKFLFVQWRIARMCSMRADRADRVDDVEDALGEDGLAKRLDDLNAAYQRIRSQIDWVTHQKGVRLTPREGLRIGLDRADFRLAKAFAQQILESDPYDTRANFAMGMSYFIDKRYGRAEVYLKRCLARTPKEPAVLNNLAIAQMRMGKLAEAKRHVREAFRLCPDSPEVKKTFEAIEKAMAK